MTSSLRIERIQARFQVAAAKGEGLTLDADEVALLAEYEDGAVAVMLPRSDELPIGRNSLYYIRTLSLVKPAPFVTLIDGGVKICLCWDVFLSRLEQWDDTPNWEFSDNQIIIPRTSGNVVIPYGNLTDTQSQRSAAGLQIIPRRNGKERDASAGCPR